MTYLFEDGTATVDGIRADAIGGHPDVPLLSERTRLVLARRALARGDRPGAEALAARDFVSRDAEGTVRVTFVAPPDWGRYGDALWDAQAGAAHAVFNEATMLVDGVALRGCVGLPFADEAARRDCAAWCLRNGLGDVAERVARTPVGGDGPHCTWPDGDLGDVEPVDVSPPRRPKAREEVDDHEWDDLPEETDTDADVGTEAATERPDLYGAVYGVRDA